MIITKTKTMMPATKPTGRRNENEDEPIFFWIVDRTMSYTDGKTFTVNTGEVLDELTDKVGSFFLLFWPDVSNGATDGASALFAVSKNGFSADLRRLSCVKDGSGQFLVPICEGNDIRLTMNDGTVGMPFYVKIMG